MTDPLGRLQTQDRFLVRQHDTAVGTVGSFRKAFGASLLLRNR